MFLILLILFQIFSCFFVSIYEKNRPKIMIFWAIFVAVVPLGLIFYLLFGNSLKIKTRKKLKSKYKSTKKYLQQTDWHKHYKKDKLNFNHKTKHLYNSYFDVWHYKEIETYSSGQDFVSSLIAEISKAKSFIFLEFYIFCDDTVGNTLKDVLIKKANEGVEIKILYDDFGSHSTPDEFWNEMRASGIEIVSFFPSKYKFFNLRINYRNHRKIVIIDGKIAYIGGLNIRDDHMGLTELKPWKDIMVKISGGAIYPILNVFLNDYFSQVDFDEDLKLDKYFLELKNVGEKYCQFIYSGPDDDKKHIYNTYLHSIKSANKYMFVETPYFILDGKMFKALKNAIRRGVKIDVIIPQIPDKAVIYGASLRYAKRLSVLGAKIYAYSGFMHSKIFVVDNDASIGSCNFDNRSFKLNFEDTLLIYNKEDVNKIQTIIKEDKKNSILLKKEDLDLLLQKYKLNPLVFYIIKSLI